MEKRKEVKSYKDYDGKIVRVGDRIESVEVGGKPGSPLGGTVEKIFKQGFYVHPVLTEQKSGWETHWGRFTRKVIE